MKIVQGEAIAPLNVNMFGKVSGGLANEQVCVIFIIYSEPVKRRDRSIARLKTRLSGQIRSFHE